MNLITSCPICHSKGVVLITDYVDHSLQHEKPLSCPLCSGLGVLKKPSWRTIICR